MGMGLQTDLVLRIAAREVNGERYADDRLNVVFDDCMIEYISRMSVCRPTFPRDT